MENGNIPLINIYITIFLVIYILIGFNNRTHSRAVLLSLISFSQSSMKKMSTVKFQLKYFSSQQQEKV